MDLEVGIASNRSFKGFVYEEVSSLWVDDLALRSVIVAVFYEKTRG